MYSKYASVPTGLFVDTPEMNDVQRHPLGNEFEEWPEEITQKLKERVPKASGLNLMVKFQSKDEETGTATGAVIIGSTEKSAIVPIIVKDFKLYPLDVMIADNKMVPFTPDYFEAIFMSNNLFQKMEEYPMYGGMGRFDNHATNIQEAIYPPNTGRYSYAGGGYNLLEAIASTIDPTEFTEYLNENPMITKQLVKKGHDLVIKSITNIQPVNMNDFKQTARDLVPRTIFQVKKDGRGGYDILTNSDVVFDPRMANYATKDLTSRAISELSSEPHDWLNDVDRNGEKTLYTKEDMNGVYLFRGDEDVPIQAEEFGYYCMKKKNGVNVKGFVIPKVISFDMELTPLKLFLGKTNCTIQDTFAGVKIDRYEDKLKTDVPKAGQTGSFVLLYEGRALGTVPVTIESVYCTDFELCMKVRDLNGARMLLKKSKYNHALMDKGYELQKIVNINAVPKGDCPSEIGETHVKMTPEYRLPESFIWCPMEGFHELSNSIADYTIKTAGDYKTCNPAKIIKTGYGFYSVKGLDKYATSCDWDKTNLHETQVRFILASLNTPESVVDSAIKTAHFKGYSEVHGIDRVPTYNEKKASKIPTATIMVKICSLLKSNLIKEASYIENNQTVDALLGLNFINPDNMSKFINFLPQFKSTISSLCGCLMAARMGMNDIPEQAASSAMYRLIDVVNGLEKMRTVQEQGLK